MITSDFSGGGQATIDALEAVGVRAGWTPRQVVEIAIEIVGALPGQASRSVQREPARTLRLRG